MPVKDDLKTIVTKRLSGVASTFFIEKVLVVLDESADTKESFLSAADLINKRIALFVDTALAKEIYDILRAEIESRSKNLTQGARRKHVRVNFSVRVPVTHNGTTSELFTANISLGGLYLKTTKPFAVGSTIEMSLSLKDGTRASLKGVVVNARSGDERHPSGMGIEFKEVRDTERKIITELVKEAASREFIPTEVTK
ncbi:MAG: PilZ domain-containing protein [Nitrospirae bacterium]|nr:PilZ domain-containing protein [Nitrospirota bacterium]